MKERYNQRQDIWECPEWTWPVSYTIWGEGERKRVDRQGNQVQHPGGPKEQKSR